MMKRKISNEVKINIKQEIDKLAPWYQPIKFYPGLKTRPGNYFLWYNKEKLDRGVGKWNKFIKPNLPFDLKGKNILDCGCNAGLFLIEACNEGASKAFGLEVDDHYYQQALFTKKTFAYLNNRTYPIEIFKSSFEDFDISRLPNIDICFFLNTIYHIGRATHSEDSVDNILKIQSQMLKKLSLKCKYILFQANPLEDEGRGKGKESLHLIIQKAGLKIEQETSYNHPRGLLTLVKC